jgi:hypothetical protein
VKALPATLVLAFALSAACGGTRQPAAARPISVDALTPQGATAWPFEFAWKTNAPPDAVYRVSVYDVAERPLYEHDTRGTRLPGPGELLRQAGSRLLWRVSVLGDDGTAVAQSPLVEFAVK